MRNAGVIRRYDGTILCTQLNGSARLRNGRAIQHSISLIRRNGGVIRKSFKYTYTDGQIRA